MPLPLLVLLAASGAIAGNQVGYLLGRVVERCWFRGNARVLKLKHLETAEVFFKRCGGRALALARFGVERGRGRRVDGFMHSGGYLARAR